MIKDILEGGIFNMSLAEKCGCGCGCGSGSSDYRDGLDAGVKDSVREIFEQV